MRLAIGYVPLTDAAPVIAAVELGFTAAEGLAVTLSREPSWATLRDRLALGHLDGAHILAPLAIAVTLGLSGARAALIAPIALNLNGNALTVSLALWREMAAAGAVDGDLQATARAFATAARRRVAAGERLTVATVFPFSTHTYQLRRFAEAGGLALEAAVSLITVPPPDMVTAMASGGIDAFCVGSPWNGLAVAAGIGRIAAFGVEITPDAPEKVLALPAHGTDQRAMLALVRAVDSGSRWCADPVNHDALAALLAEPRHLGLDADPIRRSLSGRLLVSRDGQERSDARYITFGYETARPEPARERWLLGEMAAAGQMPFGATPELYRPDLYDEALGAAQ